MFCFSERIKKEIRKKIEEMITKDKKVGLVPFPLDDRDGDDLLICPDEEYLDAHALHCYTEIVGGVEYYVGIKKVLDPTESGHPFREVDPNVKTRNRQS